MINLDFVQIAGMISVIFFLKTIAKNAINNGAEIANWNTGNDAGWMWGICIHTPWLLIYNR